jgi:hypothetical protein
MIMTTMMITDIALTTLTHGYHQKMQNYG